MLSENPLGFPSSLFRTVPVSTPPLVGVWLLKARWFLETPSAGPVAVHRDWVGREDRVEARGDGDR